MFHLLLRHESPVVRLLEILGVLGMGVFIASASGWIAWGPLARAGLGIFLVGYLFLRYCASVQWYPRPTPADAQRVHLGIELHFRRMLVSCSYVVSLTALWLWLGGWPMLLWGMNVVVLFFGYCNGVLLWCHYHDHHPIPVNYYSTRHEGGPTGVACGGALLAPGIDDRIDTVAARHI